jgi:hypothetical protein
MTNEPKPSPEREEDEDELDLLEMPGGWIFGMLADLALGPTDEEIMAKEQKSQGAP